MGRKLGDTCISIRVQRVVSTDEIRRVFAEDLLWGVDTCLKMLRTFGVVTLSTRTEFLHRSTERIPLRLQHEFQCLDV